MSAAASHWKIYDELLDSIPTTTLVAGFHVGQRWLMLESDSGGIGVTQRFPSAAGAFGDLEENMNVVGRSLRGASDKVKGCAFNLFLPRIRGKRVTVVGHFPHLENLCTQCTLSILERNPRSSDLPDMAAEYILPDQDAVFITGTAFTNKTITRLLELTRKAEVYMVGPSTPMNPLLFNHGITSLSGLVVTDRDGVAKATQPSCCEDIFRNGGAKVNMVREGA